VKGLDLASRTRGHLHNLMRVLWNCAMRWELTEIGENPMKLVRVRGTSKRQREPMVLALRNSVPCSRSSMSPSARWLSSISPRGSAAASSSPLSGVTCSG